MALGASFRSETPSRHHSGPIGPSRAAHRSESRHEPPPLHGPPAGGRLSADASRTRRHREEFTFVQAAAHGMVARRLAGAAPPGVDRLAASHRSLTTSPTEPRISCKGRFMTEPDAPRQVIAPTPITPMRAKPLPPPSPSHASCPWCRARFATIVLLLDHVDRWHLPPEPSAA
jgi:hypothetical protein